MEPMFLQLNFRMSKRAEIDCWDSVELFRHVIVVTACDYCDCCFCCDCCAELFRIVVTTGSCGANFIRFLYMGNDFGIRITYEWKWMRTEIGYVFDMYIGDGKELGSAYGIRKGAEQSRIVEDERFCRWNCAELLKTKDSAGLRIIVEDESFCRWNCAELFRHLTAGSCCANLIRFFHMGNDPGIWLTYEWKWMWIETGYVFDLYIGDGKEHGSAYGIRKGAEQSNWHGAFFLIPVQGHYGSSYCGKWQYINVDRYDYWGTVGDWYSTRHGIWHYGLLRHYGMWHLTFESYSNIMVQALSFGNFTKAYNMYISSISFKPSFVDLANAVYVGVMVSRLASWIFSWFVIIKQRLVYAGSLQPP